MNKKGKTVKNEAPVYENLPFLAREQYKRLRTNLQFALVNEGKCPIIGITSSLRGEGKSTTSVNLAYTYVQQGSKVLLIDGDLRLSSVAKKMRTSNARGLTNFLIGEEDDVEKFRSPSFENWYILTAGKTPPNPSELLGSAKMKALLEKFQEQFDYIFIDLPPVNLVSDALTIAKSLSGFVVVVRDHYTSEKQLEQCIRQLSFVGANILGLVMNDVNSPIIKGGKSRNYEYYE